MAGKADNDNGGDWAEPSPATTFRLRKEFVGFDIPTYSLGLCVGAFSTLGPIQTVWIFTNSRIPKEESSRP